MPAAPQRQDLGPVKALFGCTSHTQPTSRHLLHLGASMEASEIKPDRCYHNGRGVSFYVDAVQSGQVYYHVDGLKGGLRASMALEEFAKAMTEELKSEANGRSE